jgi:hypothetical protein
MNQALHNITLVPMRIDRDTKDYGEKRTAEGRGKREIMCCLKQYLARKLHRALTTEQDGQARNQPLKSAA